jgi:hypothetical protein
MVSKHLSVRVDGDLLQQLEDECRRSGQSRSAVAKRFLEEGLRMERHPGIMFRPGPAGRRPALAEGPDVWEVARVFRHSEGSEKEKLSFLVDDLALRDDQVQAAARYYEEFREEIDTWIDRMDEEADKAYAEWKGQQAALRA